jgi:hypothetical protein
VTLRRIVAKLVRKGVVDQTPDADSRLWRQSSAPVVQLAQHQPRVHKQKEITMRVIHGQVPNFYKITIFGVSAR